MCHLCHHLPVFHVLQLRPEDRRWRSLPGLGHVFPSSPLRQQRHHYLPLPVRRLQLSAGEALRLPPELPRPFVFLTPLLLFCCPTLQGPFVFFFRVVFNKEARSAMKYCCSRKRPDHTIKSKASVSPSKKTGFLLHIHTFAGGLWFLLECPWC